MSGPGLVFCDAFDKFFLVLEHGHATGESKRIYLDEIQRKLEFFGEARRLLDMQDLVHDIEFQYCYAQAAADLFSGAADGSQGPLKRCTRRDHFEDFVLRERKIVIALAIGDIGDADPDQFAIAGRQAAEANLARYLRTGRILVHPFEYRMLAIQCT